MNIGDKVRDISGTYNYGLAMTITEIKEGGKVRCEYFQKINNDLIHKMEWLDEEDLILVESQDGGFRNPGE